MKPIGNLVNHKLLVRENKPVAFSEKTLEKVKQLIRRYPEGQARSAILPVLHIAQEELGGYLTVDIMDYVASLLGLLPIQVYEVATFYSMFFMEKVGKYVIEVCQTGPCMISGNDELLGYLEEKLGVKRGETSADGLFTLRTVECLGACGYAPVMQVNTIFHEHLDRVKIDRIIDELRKKSEETQHGEETWAEGFC